MLASAMEFVEMIGRHTHTHTHIFNNLQLYKRRAWLAQGKKPVKHHDVWEDILLLLQDRTAPVSMTHVYGHNKMV